MSITIPHKKELFSAAYATAVAALAGVSISRCIYHDYGIDLTFSPISILPSGKRQCTGHDYHFQLKCTIDYTLTDQFVIYDLDADAYNLLAYWNGPSPCYLLLMCLPLDNTNWLDLTEDFAKLHKCCYWEYIASGNPTQNKSSRRIKIPRHQIFTCEALLSLMNGRKSGWQK